MAEETEAKRVGRPFTIRDPEELRTKIQTYFDNCDPHLIKKNEIVGHRDDGMAMLNERQVLTKQRPYTVTGLALHLGVTRETLREYRKKEHYPSDIDPKIRNEIIDSIESAVMRVEVYNEEQLHLGNANGVKFNLTNNFGWVDKQVVDNNNRDITTALDELDDIADNAKEQLEDSDAGSETPE